MSADMFGFDAAPAKRINNRPEAAALAEVLQALKHHPLVARNAADVFTALHQQKECNDR
ncbi:MAG: hypothetical protein WBO95_08295 [Candidatus Dechloromonas phosphoritropha]|mgnify:CR=1 FL=1